MKAEYYATISALHKKNILNKAGSSKEMSTSMAMAKNRMVTLDRLCLGLSYLQWVSTFLFLITKFVLFRTFMTIIYGSI